MDPALSARAVSSPPTSATHEGADRGREVAARRSSSRSGSRRRCAGFDDRTDPNALVHGRRPGRRVRASQGLPADPGCVRPRPEWTTGPVEVSSAMQLVIRARCSRRASAARVAGRSRRCTAGHRGQAVRAARRPRRVRPVDDDRQPGPVRQRGHRDVRRCRGGRGRHQAREHARHVRGRRADQEDRHGAPDLATSCSRTPRRSRAT